MEAGLNRAAVIELGEPSNDQRSADHGRLGTREDVQIERPSRAGAGGTWS